MRQITQKAVQSFKNNTNFKLDNTEVKNFYPSETRFLLHDNMIAKRAQGGLYISSCGWQTTTTKERLNGILAAYNLPTIYQKRGKWFYSDGVEFVDGKIFEL